MLVGVARCVRWSVYLDVDVVDGNTVVAVDFESFVHAVEPRLRRALAGHVDAEDVGDALAEAFAYAWQHWGEVSTVPSPVGLLFRVAQSRSRRRRQGFPPAPDPGRLPQVEPGLGAAMRALPGRQRSVVWLVHGCGWTHSEVADGLGISASAVGTHLARGLSGLRRHLGASNEK